MAPYVLSDLQKTHPVTNQPTGIPHMATSQQQALVPWATASPPSLCKDLLWGLLKGMWGEEGGCWASSCSWHLLLTRMATTGPARDKPAPYQGLKAQNDSPLLAFPQK